MYFCLFENILTEFFILGYPGEGPTKCMICQKPIKRGAMQQHIKGEHKCSTCGISFSKTRDYHDHRLSHGKHPKKCTICQKVIKRRTMQQHIKEDHKCSTCGVSVSTAKEYHRHRRRHQPIYKRGATKQCSICRVSFSRAYDCNQHQQKDHSQCTICHKRVGYGNMRKHIRDQHKCSTCEVSFQTARQYNRHQHRHQEKCTICLKYVARGSMKEHINVNHKYKCSYCDGYTSYGRKCSCKECQFCHEWFQRGYLLPHLRKKHTCGDKTQNKIKKQRQKIIRMERRLDPWHHYDKVNSVFQILIVRMKTFM